MICEQPARRDAAKATKTLSVVIPAYDEAKSIAESVQRVAAWLDARYPDGELWVIDDGSTDETRAILERLCSDLRSLKLDGFQRNRGRGAALRLGMTRAQGRVVVTTEADLSWGLDILAELAALIRNGATDVAVASPHSTEGRLIAVPWRRRALSRGANRLARLALGGGVTMATGATRAYRRDVLAQVLSPLDGKAFHLDTLCRAQRAGMRISELPATLRWHDAARARRPLGASNRLAREIASHLKVLGEHVYVTRRSA